MNDNFGNLKINVSLDIREIIELDISKGVLTSNLVFGAKWYDINLAWNKTLKGNISRVTIKASAIWHPIIQICNSVTGKSKFDEDKKVTVRHDGIVFLYTEKIFHTYCKINMEKYPFDAHMCHLEICMEEKTRSEAVISSCTYDLGPQNEFHEWEFLFSNSTESKFTATAVIRAKRKITLVTVTKVIPVIMLTILILAVYLLPAESGEKVSYAVTLFLSNIVLLSEASQLMSNNSRTFSIYLVYLLFLTTISGFSCFASIISTNKVKITKISPEPSTSQRKTCIRESPDEENTQGKFADVFKRMIRGGKKYIFFSVTIMSLLLIIIFGLLM
ncbi:acetylcholine receptor subunit beta-type unc-29-like [Octopus sinensis]|uniref:Acetylcholine receptor subunit beta-type unc-29-like n=1 Tax=Octopus sinensis TaxID=2607531 RepID=A0A6P7TA59_9MOLL|nr:acetylcholine receptor subunit beta-type unc-29-like [Octopus sinensis]